MHPIAVTDSQTVSANDAYVLNIVPLSATYAISTSVVEGQPNTIGLYDKTSLRHIGSFKGHGDGVTCLKRTQSTDPGLGSCGRDGVVKIWDERVRPDAESARFTSVPKKPLLCLDASTDGNTLAAGTELSGDDASIIFWDLRNSGSSPLHIHNSTHSDDITSLSFHPYNTTDLLSVSTDGLINLSNAREADEDEAVNTTANWGTSISRAGWMGGTRVWSASDMETLAIWSAELDPILDYGDVRQFRVEEQWSTDYIIDAGWFDSPQLSPFNSPGWGIWLGSNLGNLSLIDAREEKKWKLHYVLNGGHEGLVRCVLWDAKNSVVLTGGEDSRLNAWRIPEPNSTVEPEDTVMEMDMDMEADASPRGGVVGTKRGFGDEDLPSSSSKKVRY